MNNNLNNVIAKKAILAFLAILLICCSYSKKSSKDFFEEIRQVKRCLSFPTLTVDNKFIVVKDSQYLIYYKDLVLYKFPYEKTYSSNLFDAEGNIIEHKLIKTEIKFHCLIYQKGELYGYAYDSTQDLKGKKVLVDSFLNSRLQVIEKFVYSPYDSLVEVKSEPGNTIHEIYVRKLKTDKWDCDTNHLFFSDNFKYVDFSISKKLDSIKKSKLFKIRQVSNGDPNNDIVLFQHAREVLLELKEYKTEDNEEILSLFERFKVQSNQ